MRRWYGILNVSSWHKLAHCGWYFSRPAAKAVWGVSDPRETSLHCSTWPSFDHLVGAGKQRCWYGEAKGFRGLEIDQ
jgi:hypothetical protein